jgi:hypothetical protein
MTIETQLRALGTHLDDAQDPITVDDIRGSVDAVDSGQDEFDFDNSDSPSPVRWLAVAAIIIVALVGIWLVAQRVNDDEVPADTPPSATTAPVIDAEASVVIDGFFDAYGTVDVDTVAGLLAEDVEVSVDESGSDPLGATPVPGYGDPGEPAAPPEYTLAWMLAQSELVSEPTCDEIAVQPADGITMRCDYTSRDPLAQAVDADLVPTRSTITVTDAKISTIHVHYDNGDHTDLADPFKRWAEHLEVDGPNLDMLLAGLESGARSPSEVAATGRLRAHIAQRWSEDLDRHDCPTLEPCTPDDAPGRHPTGEEYEAFYYQLVDALPPSGRSEPPPEDRPLVWITRPCNGKDLALPILNFVIGGWYGAKGDVAIGIGGGPEPARQIAPDLIDYLQTCLPAGSEVEQLPPSIPAKGFIVDSSHALFVVAHPEGGVVALALKDFGEDLDGRTFGNGDITTELVAEVATLIDTMLTDPFS